ncbi:MAG: DNA-binding protein [Bacteroidales bacterium]|nr:DNA-binding protein [Bacteroidales bacterium]
MTEPQVADNGRYSIKKTCEMLGIHRNTLRKYTLAGVIKCGYRPPYMRKFYIGKEIVRCWKKEL